MKKSGKNDGRRWSGLVACWIVALAAGLTSCFSDEELNVPVKQTQVSLETELDQLIEETINLHRHMPEAAGIAFKTNVGIYKVFSDKHHLEVILRNLVSNAIKYHDGAKQNQFILIQTSSDRDKVKIEVVDNGIGIDDKDQQNIFNMYYKTGNSLNSSGLGLHIVSEMVKKLEGTIAVQSSKGVGTTFTLLLRK